MKIKEVEKFLFILILGILFINLTSAYDLGAVKKDGCADLYQHCSDCSFVNVTSIKNPNQTIIYLNEEMNKNGYDFTYNYCNNNQSGDYFYTVCGDPVNKEPCKTYSYVVTESGVETTQTRAISSIALLGIMIFLLLISLFAMFKVEDYKGKFALYWVSHIFLILIFFVGWQVGVEGLLGGMALTGVFRIFFWISTVAMLPMVILSIVWVVYIHLFNEHFEKLIEQGEDPETAFRMTKKSRGGWFYGKR